MANEVGTGVCLIDFHAEELYTIGTKICGELDGVKK